MSEKDERDAALALLEKYRGELITIARAIAACILDLDGEVSSTTVWRMMEVNPHHRFKIAQVDKRWMGAVFPLPGTKRVRWDDTGSHARPVAVWVRV